ncbi:MAG: hypothetical protein ACK459_00285 [Akkermansiaceae bacterium]
MNATREKTRLWLLILVGVVATLLGQTHAREIFAPSPHESGIFAEQTQASTGENYDACQYDTLDSLLAAKGGDEMIDVYRVFGGDARAQGFSWTTVDPRTVKNFRDGAGLPSGGASGSTNTADFLIKGRVQRSDVLEFKMADPLDGNRGGLPELKINPNNVRLNDFSILNP